MGSSTFEIKDYSGLVAACRVATPDHLAKLADKVFFRLERQKSTRRGDLTVFFISESGEVRRLEKEVQDVPMLQADCLVWSERYIRVHLKELKSEAKRIGDWIAFGSGPRSAAFFTNMETKSQDLVRVVPRDKETPQEAFLRVLSDFANSFSDYAPNYGLRAQQGVGVTSICSFEQKKSGDGPPFAIKVHGIEKMSTFSLSAAPSEFVERVDNSEAQKRPRGPGIVIKQSQINSSGWVGSGW